MSGCQSLVIFACLIQCVPFVEIACKDVVQDECDFIDWLCRNIKNCCSIAGFTVGLLGCTIDDGSSLGGPLACSCGLFLVRKLVVVPIAVEVMEDSSGDVSAAFTRPTLTGYLDGMSSSHIFIAVDNPPLLASLFFLMGSPLLSSAFVLASASAYQFSRFAKRQ